MQQQRLIEGFIAKVNASTNMDKDWREFVKSTKVQDLSTIIEDKKLKPEETKKFIDNSFRDRYIKTTGTDIDKILP